MDLWYFELDYIPEAITNLKALKSLQISIFGKKTVRVSRGTKNFLDSFPHLTLESKLFLNL